MLLDEKTLRKPEFSEGAAVVLGDGQAWIFPEPDTPGLPPGPPAFTIEQAREWKALNPDAPPMDPGQVLVTLMGMAIKRAAELLLWNYAIPNSGLRTLLVMSYGDDENLAMWERIQPVLVSHLGPPVPLPTPAA